MALAGAGMPAGRLLRGQLAEAGLQAALLRQAEDCISQLDLGQRVSALPALSGLFRSSVQPFLISWLARDPVAELAKVAAPTLVVQGSRDLQIDVENALALAGCRDGIQLEVIECMNHVLKLAPEARSENLATYAKPDLPLAPGLVAGIRAFIETC